MHIPFGATPGLLAITLIQIADSKWRQFLEDVVLILSAEVERARRGQKSVRTKTHFQQIYTSTVSVLNRPTRSTRHFNDVDGQVTGEPVIVVG